MPKPSAVKSVALEGDYYHVRFRHPDNFDEIRTPKWAADIANEISEGAEVRTGRVKNQDKWEIQSVLIRADGVGKKKAEELAKKIHGKIEDRED